MVVTVKIRDTWLQRKKEHVARLAGWFRGFDHGELELLVLLVVSHRWLREKLPSYEYEMAQVFDKDRSTIGKILKNLESKGLVEKWIGRTRQYPFSYKYRPTDKQIELLRQNAIRVRFGMNMFRKYSIARHYVSGWLE